MKSPCTITLEAFGACNRNVTLLSELISGEIKFPPPHNACCANAAAANESTIKGLTKQIVTKGNKTFSFNLNNNCACFAYPASYGDLKSIKDPNNFEVLGTFTKSTVQITGLDGTPQTYNVYVNEASTASGFAFTFAY